MFNQKIIIMKTSRKLILSTCFLLMLLFGAFITNADCNCDSGSDGTCMIITVNGHCTASCSTQSEVTKDCSSGGGGGNQQ